MTALEFRRKVFHLFALLLWLLPVKYLSFWQFVILFLIVVFLNFLTVLQFGKDGFLRRYYAIVFTLEREKNLSKPSVQALWANLGIGLSYILFGPESAMAGIITLAIGDAFASLVGQSFARIRIFSKSLEGSAAFFISSSLALYPIFESASFLLAFIGAIIELLPSSLDDNLSIPL
ncbi:MAG: phosphatidate cytidylyltransferase, partial [Aquificaceae bacterium]|nr:phosphatidate cytidylyltransferase [Aquificaceae bacterium]